MAKIINREDFDKACEALWSEIEYQNKLPRRTDEEAKDVPGFATLARCYLSKLENDWAYNAGVDIECLNGLRKLSTIFLRGMIYCGIKSR